MPPLTIRTAASTSHAQVPLAAGTPANHASQDRAGGSAERGNGDKKKASRALATGTGYGLAVAPYVHDRIGPTTRGAVLSQVRNPRDVLFDPNPKLKAGQKPTLANTWKPKVVVPTRGMDDAARVLGQPPAGTTVRITNNRSGVLHTAPSGGNTRIMSPTPNYPKGYVKFQKDGSYFAADGNGPKTSGLKGPAAKAAVIQQTHFDTENAAKIRPGYEKVMADVPRGRNAVVPKQAGAFAAARQSLGSLAYNPALTAIGKAVSKASGPLAAVIGAVDIGTTIHAEGKFGEQSEQAVGRTVGGMGGAIAGAAIGSMILPVVGTVVGGIVGGIAGSYGGEKIANDAFEAGRSAVAGVSSFVGGLLG